MTVRQVEELWRATDNTVGFTFMVSSASDRSALVMETKKVCLLTSLPAS